MDIPPVSRARDNRPWFSRYASCIVLLGLLIFVFLFALVIVICVHVIPHRHDSVNTTSDELTIDQQKEIALRALQSATNEKAAVTDLLLAVLCPTDRSKIDDMLKPYITALYKALPLRNPVYRAAIQLTGCKSGTSHSISFEDFKDSSKRTAFISGIDTASGSQTYEDALKSARKFFKESVVNPGAESVGFDVTRIIVMVCKGKSNKAAEDLAATLYQQTFQLYAIEFGAASNELQKVLTKPNSVYLSEDPRLLEELVAKTAKIFNIT